MGLDHVQSLVFDRQAPFRRLNLKEISKMGIPFTDLTGFGRFSGVDDVAIWRRADCNSLLSEPVKQQSPCL